jgi:putative flippase GtrA
LPLALSFLFTLGILIAKVIFKSIKFLFQLAKFAETGVLNTLIDMGIYNGLIWLTGITSGAFMIPLNIFSFSCATGNSYFWNKHWTFEKNDKAKGKEFIEFFIVTMIGMGINTLIVFLGTTFFSPMMGLSAAAWANLIKIGATMFSMIWNFAGYKFIVFKK